VPKCSSFFFSFLCKYFAAKSNKEDLLVLLIVHWWRFMVQEWQVGDRKSDNAMGKSHTKSAEWLVVL
jgi:hypothetical protein